MKNSFLAEMDAGLKACLAILLAVIAINCENRLSLLLIFLYMVLATILMGSNLRFLYKNALSYGIIILFPYFCGLLLSAFLGLLFSTNTYVTGLSFAETLLRVVKIFFIWYIGSMYIYSTPLPAVLGMLKKAVSPLHNIGVPVNRYLVMLKCILNELNESVADFKSNSLEQARIIFRKKASLKTKTGELAEIIVFFIVNSLHRTEHIQNLVAKTDINDLTYSLKVARNEVWAVLSFAMLLTAVIISETMRVI
jgi:energy-coupling factor transporter transmembrane protein EcfT